MSFTLTSAETQMASPSHYRRKRTASLVTVSSGRSRISLQAPVVEQSVPPRTSSPLVYGSFTPTASAQASLSHIRHSSLGGKAALRLSSSARSDRYWDDDDADSPLSSGVPSPVIPSIMRTCSSSTLEGLPSPLLPSAVPAYLHQNLAAASSSPKGKAKEEMNPILARLERKSRLLSQKAQCAACGKVGADFPRCGRCNMMWCSRDCRMSGGKRHVCNPKH